MWQELKDGVMFGWIALPVICLAILLVALAVAIHRWKPARVRLHNRFFGDVEIDWPIDQDPPDDGDPTSLPPAA